MSYNLIWIFPLILHTFVASFPLPNQLGDIGIDPELMNISPIASKYEGSSDSANEKVISVRITSSVAVGRGKGKPFQIQPDHVVEHDLKNHPSKVSSPEAQSSKLDPKNEEIQSSVTDIPPNLIGANIEYIKQLNAKKELGEHTESARLLQFSAKAPNDRNDESLQRDSSIRIDEYEEDIKGILLARKVPSTADVNQFQEQKANRRYQNIIPSMDLYAQDGHNNITNDALFKPLEISTIHEDTNKKNENFTTSTVVNQESDEKETRDLDHLMSISKIVANTKNDQNDDSVAESSIKSVEFAKYNDDISQTVTIPPAHSSNNFHDLSNRLQNRRRYNPRLTTVSFNIVHDSPKTANDNEPSNSYISSSQVIPNHQQLNQPPKIYSQPAQVYSEPAKFYSEPAKIYSEPAKVYSEPAKVYSEPAKIYSEPSKFYSEPASLHLNENVHPSVAPNYSPWQRQRQHSVGSTTINTTPISTATNAFHIDSTQMEHEPEKNYEVDEKISILTDGRIHGVQPETTTEKCKQDNCKVGYVVEGRQFKKYRVEERTPDGFIVGEYGVVRNEDGALRGVRYTADSDASPRLIHDALMKFLQLK